MSTIYLRFKEAQTHESVAKIYREFFASSPMVRIYEKTLPQIQYSVRTNFADIGFQISSDGRRAVIVSCLDNLLKGASGQASDPGTSARARNDGQRARDRDQPWRSGRGEGLAVRPFRALDRASIIAVRQIILKNGAGLRGPLRAGRAAGSSCAPKRTNGP